MMNEDNLKKSLDKINIQIEATIAVLSGGRTLCAGGQQQWHGSTRSSVALRDTMPLARYRAGAGQLDLSTAPKQLCALSTGAAGARSGQRPYRQEHKRW